MLLVDWDGLFRKKEHHHAHKKFRFRLWLVKRLLESVMAGRIDELPEFVAISVGVAHLHSAIENEMPGERVEIDTTHIAVVRSLANSGRCNGFSCGECPFDKGPHPVTVDMAKRWLREHGIKEEA